MRRCVAAGLPCLLAVFSVVPALAHEKPLSTNDVVTMIKGGLDEREIIADLRRRKIHGPLSSDDEKRLAEACRAAGGGSSIVLEARNPANVVAGALGASPSTPAPAQDSGLSREEAERRVASARVTQLENDKFEAEMRWLMSVEETRSQGGEGYLEEVERRNARTRANAMRPPAFANYHGDDPEAQQRKGTSGLSSKAQLAIEIAEWESRRRQMENSIIRLKGNIRKFQDLARTEEQRERVRPFIEEWQRQVGDLEATLPSVDYEIRRRQ